MLADSFIVGGWIILDKSLDTFTWNVIFVFINCTQAAILIYKMVPFRFKVAEYGTHASGI